MNSTPTILSIKSVPLADGTPGNTLTFELGISGQTQKVYFALGVDSADGNELYFELDPSNAKTVSTAIDGYVTKLVETRNTVLEKALHFKSAQLACAIGQIGKLQIEKIGPSELTPQLPGFGRYTLTYVDDSGDDQVIAEVENIEMYVAASQELQIEWVRTLVGGNHQHTTTIQVSLVGFTFADIDAEFEAAVNRHVAEYTESHTH